MLNSLFDHHGAGGKSGFVTAFVALNCDVVVDRNVFIFFFGPTHTPRPLPPRRAEEGANTTFGRVHKQRKYTRQGTLKKEIFNLFVLTHSGVCTDSLHRHSQIWLMAPLSRPAGRERVGERVGPKMKTNKSLSIPATHFDATAQGTSVRQPGRKPACLRSEAQRHSAAC